MDIRSFKKTDNEKLAELYLKSRIAAFPWLSAENFSLSDFARDTEEEKVLVGVANGTIVGFSSVWLPENFLHNLFIHPEHFGQGYGSTLLMETIKNLELPAQLKCQQRNIRALSFYKSRGWSKVGEGAAEIGNYELLELRGIA